MNDDRFGDPINSDWPMPVSRPPKQSLWARFVEWLIGRRESDEA